MFAWATIDSLDPTLSALKLTSLFVSAVRHEAGGQAFAQLLTAFLTSFTGLKHLDLPLEEQIHCKTTTTAPIGLKSIGGIALHERNISE